MQILANKEPIVLEDQPFLVLVHPEEINIEVPTFVEISAEDTLACVKALKENQWQHMSTGELFRLTWYKIFRDNAALETHVPANVESLHASSTGVRHIAGLIILACEAMFEGKSVFLRNPETFLHPSTEQRLVGGLLFMRALVLGGDSILTYYQMTPEVIKDETGHAALRRKKKYVDKFKKELKEISSKLLNTNETQN